MSYHHQLFPDPPPQPRVPGRHRQEAADPAWGFEPQPWDRPQSTQHHQADDGHGRELQSLGSAYRRLRRVSTFTALGYFILFLLLSAYAPSMMTGEVSGGLTTGLVLGLVQLPVALAAIAVYERIAGTRVDPLVASVRERSERTAPHSGRQPRGGARA
ncbi:DUF485 domain-containing protein [Streptomyces sp. Tu 2975]|uniref:DUF485 domain-containing protein n=1 Tax=Streptomyces sp. Tu 2975 TaxID=2676871 RepID=UPI001357C586|nr:DUF485 domain-containing protein [Streptomyces sp. Tu 2975]QIP86114.1 DUF485 domain-containing protein [Streptomyces sp. Tu 2975]